jgi:hypothetical protein
MRILSEEENKTMYAVELADGYEFEKPNGSIIVLFKGSDTDINLHELSERAFETECCDSVMRCILMRVIVTNMHKSSQVRQRIECGEGNCCQY